MIKICEICDNKFESNSATRIYCYQCIFVCSNCHKEIHSELGYKKI